MQVSICEGNVQALVEEIAGMGKGAQPHAGLAPAAATATIPLEADDPLFNHQSPLPFLRRSHVQSRRWSLMMAAT